MSAPTGGKSEQGDCCLPIFTVFKQVCGGAKKPEEPPVNPGNIIMSGKRKYDVHVALALGNCICTWKVRAYHSSRQHE